MKEQSQKNIIEAVLLAAGKPLRLDAIIDLFDEAQAPDRDAARAMLDALNKEYQGRGIEIARVASGYRLQVKKELSHWVSKLWEEKPARYTRALLETLALIAYRQPITRGEIEAARGVGVSSNIIKTLREREWVRVLGHRDVPGKPAMYGTTREFLDHFNLKSLEQLPTLPPVRDIDAIASGFAAELQLAPPDGQADNHADQPTDESADNMASRKADAKSGPVAPRQSPHDLH